MRNKLKQRKKLKNTLSLDEEQPVTVKTVLLKQSKRANKDTVEALSEHTHSACPVQEHGGKDVKIAPVFLLRPTTHHIKSKRSSEERLVHHHVGENEQLVESQQKFSAVCLPRSQRIQLSPSALNDCLQQIQTANPSFPARTVFNTLQQRAKDRLRAAGSSTATESDPDPSSPRLQEKRKRGGGGGGGGESSERVFKRLRFGLSGTGHCLAPAQGLHEPGTALSVTGHKQPRYNKLSRSHRLRPAALHSTESHSGSINHTPDILHGDSSVEDVLWIDKFSPQHSGQVIANSVSVNKLQSWLKRWKLRADCCERRREEERKREERSNDSWDCGDFQGEAGSDEDEPLCNTMLITGPPGVGKTASVYACSLELGFKVFEVNCSSQRSGRQVVSQLKEATQSHLVEGSGKDPLRPAYLSNYGHTPKSEPLPGKTVPPKKVNTGPRKNFGCSGHKGKARKPSVTLANYFKTKTDVDRAHAGRPSSSEQSDDTKPPSDPPPSNPPPRSDRTAPRDKKTATSLILFEEVDVIFDEDVGFLAAIKAFMTTTKRPVVLTTNDPSFRERFKCSSEIVFRTPSTANVCSYLQLVGLAENARLQLDDIRSLVGLCGGDVRRCLMQLQLWVLSGGALPHGRGFTEGQSTSVKHSNVTEGGESLVPECDSGCTASMLGLYPVTQNQLLNLLKCQFWSETDTVTLLRVLAESWRRGVPLLYSNLELLLPAGAQETSTTPSIAASLHVRLDGSLGPKASTATDTKCVRKVSRLSRRKNTPLSSSTFHQTPHRTIKSSRDEIEWNVARAATDCLEALADFFDLMSYLDATVTAAERLVSGSCTPEEFAWTGAQIRDGLSDETGQGYGEEEGKEGRRSQERPPDVQAAVEGLGFHRCWWRVSGAWTQAQKHKQETGETEWGRLVERLTLLPSSSRRQTLSFSIQPPCMASLSKKRYELSKKVHSIKSLMLLGNRRAVSTDYMPVLRYICHLHTEEPLRCLNYLRSINMDLSKSTIQLLAQDFS